MIVTGLFGALETGAFKWVRFECMRKLQGGFGLRSATMPGSAAPHIDVSLASSDVSSLFCQGWFFAGCIFMVVVMAGLLNNGRAAAFRRNSEVCLPVSLQLHLGQEKTAGPRRFTAQSRSCLLMVVEVPVRLC